MVYKNLLIYLNKYKFIIYIAIEGKSRDEHLYRRLS